MFDLIVEKMKEWDIDVVFAPGEDNAYLHDDFLITIDSDMDDDEKLFSLLHEVGHAIIRFDEDEYEANYPHKTNMKEEYYVEYCEEVLREEVEAWDEGFFFAQQNNINIDKQKYYQLAEECISAYEKALKGDMFSFWYVFKTIEE
jgi:hypothetical protein